MTVDKVKFVTAREFSKRRDEIFFRINRNNLYELFIEYEANEYESMSDSFRGGDESLKIVTLPMSCIMHMFFKSTYMYTFKEFEGFMET